MTAGAATSGGGQSFGLDRSVAEQLDAADPLRSFRSEFSIPRHEDGGEEIYLLGNSLGAAPRRVHEYVSEELDRWSTLGGRGHFEGDLAWAPYHELLSEPMARIVGAHPDEVVVMNSLTVNLHLLMISFYRPTPERHKILIESHAFPSDHFAVESQIRQRGFDPADSLVLVEPRAGEETLRPDDIISAIADCGSALALVMLPGVQYYSGQVLDMAAISAAAHEQGAVVGFDLAHAAGNLVLDLHNWDVDWAAWCSYKYLNGGPGGVGSAFVHRRHLNDDSLPKLLGWWGTAKEARFEMATEFSAIPTVESWQLSNSPILSMAALRASLDIFDQAGGMEPLRAKSEQQILYMDHLLDTLLAHRVTNMTPSEMAVRGCQFALQVESGEGKDTHRQLVEHGVACDWRYPNGIRVAPVPLYNSYVDIHRFVTLLAEITA